MARPIRETPFLKGKDAERFSKILKENESKKVPQEEYQRALSVYDKVMAKTPKSR